MSDPRDIRILLHASSNDAELLEIADKVLTGERISPAEGIVLYERASLGFAGTLADHVRTR
ncbi:MAG TPA: hypothetical protein PLL28_12500, partial [Chitinophagales bacterium]|nr:hypothetical protein [Chitinophagales bacterium]